MPIKAITQNIAIGPKTDKTLYAEDTFFPSQIDMRNVNVTHQGTVEKRAGYTVASLGGGALGFGAETGSTARFNSPEGICTDGVNFYIVDWGNYVIRQISIATGAVTTLAGNVGLTGHVDGVGAAVRFGTALFEGITTDGIYVYVNDGSYIRRILISGAWATNTVSTLFTKTGDAAVANFGMAMDATNFYMGSDSHTIMQINRSTGVQTTLAGQSGVAGFADGTGASATFNIPRGIVLSPDGLSLYISQISIIRKLVISTGVVTTITTYGNYGWGMAISPDGLYLYIVSADHAVRRVLISTGETVVFAGSSSTSGATDGIGVGARFYSPQAIVLLNGSFYVCDTNNNTIRKIVLSSATVSTYAGLAGASGSADGNAGTYSAGAISALIPADGGYAVAQSGGTNYIYHMTAPSVDMNFGVLTGTSRPQFVEHREKAVIAAGGAVALLDSGAATPVVTAYTILPNAPAGALALNIGGGATVIGLPSGSGTGKGLIGLWWDNPYAFLGMTFTVASLKIFNKLKFSFLNNPAANETISILVWQTDNLSSNPWNGSSSAKVGTASVTTSYGKQEYTADFGSPIYLTSGLASNHAWCIAFNFGSIGANAQSYDLPVTSNTGYNIFGVGTDGQDHLNGFGHGHDASGDNISFAKMSFINDGPKMQSGLSGSYDYTYTAYSSDTDVESALPTASGTIATTTETLTPDKLVVLTGIAAVSFTGVADYLRMYRRPIGGSSWLRLAQLSTPGGALLATPASIVATPTIGGALLNNTYALYLSATDGQGQYSTAGTATGTLVLSGSNNAFGLTWNGVPGATGYRLFCSVIGLVVDLPQTASAVFKGTIAATTLTVTENKSGSIAIGMTIAGGGITAGTKITGGSGTTWTVNTSQTVSTAVVIQGAQTGAYTFLGNESTIVGSQYAASSFVDTFINPSIAYQAYVVPTGARFVNNIDDMIVFSGFTTATGTNSTPALTNPKRSFWRSMPNGTNILQNFFAELPDDILGQAQLQRELYFFLDDTIHIWQNTGATLDMPLSRAHIIKRGLYNDGSGTGAAYSIVNANNTLFWLADDGDIYMLNGYVAERISFPGMRRRLDALLDGSLGTVALFNIAGFDCKKEHKVRWIFPWANVTLVYDYLTGIWSEDNTGNPALGTAPSGQFPINSYMEMNGVQYMGDPSSGKLYQIDRTFYSDNGGAIKTYRLFTFPLSPYNNPLQPKGHEMNKCQVKRARFRMSPNHSVATRWRFDRGTVYTSNTFTTASDNAYTEYYNLGTGREIEFTLEESGLTSPFITSILQLSYDELGR